MLLGSWYIVDLIWLTLANRRYKFTNVFYTSGCGVQRVPQLFECLEFALNLPCKQVMQQKARNSLRYDTV